ncbi:MAG TPA: nicotinamide riboside transporter PnuC [Steroidobacteraceae bacterium]|nr:nicotinamide riboside transporter PnuC [Steroidobacteraceae bacterium]
MTGAALLALLSEMVGHSHWEQLAFVLALAYLVLAIRRSQWCWAAAFVSSAIYAVLVAQAHLVMQVLLQIYYVAMACVGYWQWRRGRDAGGELEVRRWPLRAHLLAIAAVLVVSALNGAIASYFRLGEARYLDAFVTWGSVLTTWMVTRRLVENWLYWIVVDAAAAVLYFIQGLKPTSVLYLIYIGLVIHGYFAWQRTARQPRS